MVDDAPVTVTVILGYPVTLLIATVAVHVDALVSSAMTSSVIASMIVPELDAIRRAPENL